MFAASTYEEIERIERQVENMEIVVFLFARPTEEKILKEFEYIHYNSARYCSIYAIGYTDDFTKAEDRTYRKVDAMMQQDWYFSMKAFTEFKEKLQNRIHWDYSGETEILILQNNPGKRNILNFQNYVAIDVNKGIREGYIDSFQSFMESLIRSSKRRVTAKEAIRDVRNARISIKDIIAGAIDDCKKVPTPIKTSVYKGYKQDKIEMRGDRAEMSDFPLYLNMVAGGLDRRDQTISGFSFVVKIYAVPVVEIIG